MNNYFFTSDEHFGHKNVIKYNDRPFDSVEEMDEGLIERFNSKVSKSFQNITIHCGDFAWSNSYHYVMDNYIKRLNGQHVFLRGSHDAWMRKSQKHFHEMWEKKIDGKYIVACHYAMRVWPRSHYGSWMVYGHSHSFLEPFGKSWDVGVDNNELLPLSFDELCVIMDSLDDNFNLIRK